MDFTIITPDHYDAVITHLRDSFFPDEPLNYSLGLCKRGEPHAELEAHSLATLKDELSIMATDSNSGKIAGVALNGILHPDDLKKSIEHVNEVNDAKFKQIFSLLYNLSESLDLFNRYGVDVIFECRILSVDSQFRGRGLAKQLLQKSHELAIEKDFKIFKGDATGLYSQKTCELLGMKTIHELKYEDHVDDFGKQIFQTPAPHKSLKIMIKQLSPPSNEG